MSELLKAWDKYLDKISTEELQKDAKEISKLGGKGITVEEYFELVDRLKEQINEPKPIIHRQY